MKATGIVRKIDDLGRVVIPKEIRRTMRIRDGDPLEIYTNTEGEVIFKKYSPIGEMASFAAQYADVLYKMGNIPAVICDRDHVVAVAGMPKKELMERRITPAVEEVMESRKSLSFTGRDKALRPVEGVDKYASVCCPIIADGDVAGGVMLMSDGENNSPNEVQLKLAQAAAAFIAKQMEE